MISYTFRGFGQFTGRRGNVTRQLLWTSYRHSNANRYTVLNKWLQKALQTVAKFFQIVTQCSTNLDIGLNKPVQNSEQTGTKFWTNRCTVLNKPSYSSEQTVAQFWTDHCTVLNKPLNKQPITVPFFNG